MFGARLLIIQLGYIIQCVGRSCAETWKFQNTMDIDALAHCVARPSAATVLTLQDKPVDVNSLHHLSVESW